MKLIEYDRERAVAYAHRWAFERNPDYYDFSDLGGDCTSYASQCVYAGAPQMNFTPVFGWFYRTANDRTASWTGVEFFYNFMVGNETGLGPFMEEAPLQEAEPGDIIQLRFSGQEVFKHTPVVVAVGQRPHPGNILVAAHSYDSDNRPLSSYTYAQLRVLHVRGFRT